MFSHNNFFYTQKQKTNKKTDQCSVETHTPAYKEIQS